jgi:hypothetical protein
MATSRTCDAFTGGCVEAARFTIKGAQLSRNCWNKNIVALGSLFYVELYRRSLRFGRRKLAGTTASAPCLIHPCSLVESQNCRE